MEIGIIKSKVKNAVKKYKYAVLVFIIGLILLLVPGKANQTAGSTTATQAIKTELTLEQKLSAVLSQVYGAGKVEVILTRAAGEEVIYQTNKDRSVGNSAEQQKDSTVTITDSNRNQSGLIKQINPEKYLGAIVLCQGADEPAIRLVIVEAVSRITGLGANKISVLRMK